MFLVYFVNILSICRYIEISICRERRNLTQNAPEAIHVVRATGVLRERTGFQSFFATEYKINRLIMMNHLAQESRAGSVFTEMRTLRAIGEMCGCGKLHLRRIADDGQGFALNPHQCTVDILLHRATGRTILRCDRRTLRRENLYSDARQEQQYVSYAFHFSKPGAKIHKKNIDLLLVRSYRVRGNSTLQNQPS